MDNLIDTGILLVDTIFSIVMVFILLRIILSIVQMTARNTLAQFIIKTTHPLVYPLRKLLPTQRRIDYPAIIFLLILEIIYRYVIGLLQAGGLIDFSAVVLWGAGDILHMVVTIFFWAIVAQVVMSWLNSRNYRYLALQDLLHHITMSILDPLQKLIPPIGSLDITPIPALILLKLLDIYFVLPLIGWGVNAAFAGA